MAIMRISSLREMSAEELEKKLAELKLELAKEKGKIKVGGVPENPGRVKEIKKTIARIMSIKTEKIKEKSEKEKKEG